jgi:hypothetical protein
MAFLKIPIKTIKERIRQKEKRLFADLLINGFDEGFDFIIGKGVFDKIKSVVDIKYLSMGMSDSYHIAIQEGANLVRLGAAIFGPG